VPTPQIPMIFISFPALLVKYVIDKIKKTPVHKKIAKEKKP
jgi:hypothetical protein